MSGAPTNNLDFMFQYKGYDCILERVKELPALLYTCVVQRKGKTIGVLNSPMPLAQARAEAKAFCDKHYANNYAADSSTCMMDKSTKSSGKSLDLQLRVAALEKKVVFLGFAVIAVAVVFGMMMPKSQPQPSVNAIPPPTPAPAF